MLVCIPSHVKGDGRTGAARAATKRAGSLNVQVSALMLVSSATAHPPSGGAYPRWRRTTMLHPTIGRARRKVAWRGQGTAGRSGEGVRMGPFVHSTAPGREAE